MGVKLGGGDRGGKSVVRRAREGERFEDEMLETHLQIRDRRERNTLFQARYCVNYTLRKASLPDFKSCRKLFESVATRGENRRGQKKKKEKVQYRIPNSFSPRRLRV